MGTRARSGAIILMLDSIAVMPPAAAQPGIAGAIALLQIREFRPARPAAARRGEMTMLGEDILYLSVTELSERIRARKISPVELTESYLERSRQLGSRLNAYATL